MKPGAKVVLVDENLMFAAMVEPTLKRLGYVVRTIGPGPGIADRVAAEGAELVFVNLGSSRQPGADTVRALREATATSAVPIIGYAGHVERHLLQAGREAGATMVVPNSAMRSALPEVLAKLDRRLAGAAEEDWSEE